RPAAARATDRSRVLQLDLEALNQRVREQALTHPLDLGDRLAAIVCRDVDVDEPTDAGLVDVEAEVAQRALDRLPLRVEDAVPRAHENRCSHPSTVLGRTRYSSKPISVRRSNAST